jgi:hypothetical protein
VPSPNAGADDDVDAVLAGRCPAALLSQVSVLVAFTVGVAFWITAYAALGVKSFDAFMVTILLVVVAVAVRAVKPFLDRMLNRAPASAPGD